MLKNDVLYIYRGIICQDSLIGGNLNYWAKIWGFTAGQKLDPHGRKKNCCTACSLWDPKSCSIDRKNLLKHFFYQLCHPYFSKITKEIIWPSRKSSLRIPNWHPQSLILQLFLNLSDQRTFIFFVKWFCIITMCSLYHVISLL